MDSSCSASEQVRLPISKRFQALIDSQQLAAISEALGVTVNTAGVEDHQFPDWFVLACLVDAYLSHGFKGDQPIVGISGSQGSGKSTLAHVLAQRRVGMAVTSLDDFYLSSHERQLLAQRVHPLLATRGVPGTHDHAWLQRVLESAHLGAEYTVPYFDKGLDDRAGERVLAGRGLIVEGWCLGVVPEPRERLTAPCNALEEAQDRDAVWRTWVNQQIQAFYQPLWLQIDFWIHLRVPSFEQVLAWRGLQESQLPEALRMSEAQLLWFIQHYERLTRHLWQTTPQSPGLVVELDGGHNIASISMVSP